MTAIFGYGFRASKIADWFYVFTSAGVPERQAISMAYGLWERLLMPSRYRPWSTEPLSGEVES